jgi:hypothetical protein
LFNRHFTVCDLTGEGFGADGEKTGGTASTRTVRGTIQSITSRDALMLDTGARNTGNVKVYSSSILYYRQRGQIGKRSFVSHQGAVYEIIDCFHFDNKLISHEKYQASLVPTAQIPEAVREAFG